jgi:hypothetical protein
MNANETPAIERLRLAGSASADVAHLIRGVTRQVRLANEHQLPDVLDIAEHEHRLALANVAEGLAQIALAMQELSACLALRNTPNRN